MSKRVLSMAARVGLAMTTLALVTAAPAAASASRIGKNIGDEIKSWSVPLLLGLAALVAIPVLAKRSLHDGIVLALLVAIVGGFAFAPNEVKHVIESLWHAIAG